MNVQELISKLSKYSNDMIVVGRGYESGFNDVEDIEVETLVKCDVPWYDGEYQNMYNDKPSTGTAVDTPKEYLCLT